MSENMTELRGPTTARNLFAPWRVSASSSSSSSSEVQTNDARAQNRDYKFCSQAPRSLVPFLFFFFSSSAFTRSLQQPPLRRSGKHLSLSSLIMSFLFLAFNQTFDSNPQTHRTSFFSRCRCKFLTPPP